MISQPQKIGFIGLGTMGAPMAGHLIAAGYPMFVSMLNRIPASIASQATKMCANPRGVAELADVIFIMVPDTPNVKEVLFGVDGLVRP